MSYLSLSLRTSRTAFTDLRSSFASSAASAIHANASSISGPEVGTSTIIDSFKTQSTSVTKHWCAVLLGGNVSLASRGRC